MRNSNTQYNAQGSLLDMDAFNNAKPEEYPLQESADDINEDVFLSFPGITSPKESTAGAQPPSSSVDGAPLASITDTEPSGSEGKNPKTQSNLNNLPTGLSKKQQYLSYLQQLQKLSVLTEQKESGIPGDEEQLSDAAIDQLIDEILDKPTMMGGVISTLFGNLDVDDQSASIDNTPSASDTDTELSNKPSTQNTADGTDVLVELIDKLLADSDIGESTSALLENFEEEKQLTTIESMPSESHTDTQQSREPNTDDKVEDAGGDYNEDELIHFKQAYSATLIEEFLGNPGAETLVEVLMDQPGIQAIITGLTDGTHTEKLEAFLLEGPNAANIIAEIINVPRAEKRIKDILKDPKTIALIKEQIFGDMDELEEQT